MEEFFYELFDTEQFLPHGHCFLWMPKILWLNVIGDTAIALAYYSIPLTLLYLIYKHRNSIPFKWIMGLYASFIMLCGATHIISVITLWYPIYYFEGIVKIATAIASVTAAIVLFPLTSKLLNFFEQVEQKNIQLKMLNEQLKQTGQVQLRAVVDNVIDGLITISERGIIESFNPACERIFGYTVNEIIGQNIKILMPEPERSKHDGYITHYNSTGKAKIIGTPGREVSGKRKDGSIFPMDLAVSEFRLEDGRHFSGIIRDITQRKKEEIAKGLLSAIVESSAEAIISKNQDGIILTWNGAAEKLFGYTAEEAIGQHINLIIPPNLQEEEKSILAEIKTGKSVRHFETLRVGKTGHLLEVAVTISPVKDSAGKIIGVSKVVRDISERKEAEKAREQLLHAQKMESLGQLTGGIAHDFNNMLAVILGNLDFMQEKVAPGDPLQKYISPSIEAALQGAELTQRLLAFGRKQTLQPKILSLNELLEHFSTLLGRTLGERIEIIMSLAPDLWKINADPGQLENVLLNLSINARDAMPRGGKIIYETENVYLDTEYAENNPEVISGDYVMVAISDTGEGMAEEVIRKAFEPFFTTKDVGKGSGLGLSMVYGFVKQSAGHIKIYSEVNQGTSIKIYLPKVEGTASVLNRETIHDADDPEVSIKKNKLVLIVEDNDNVLKLTSAMVESLGYDVIVAITGEVAMDILASRDDINLLLSDVMLPGAINGPILAKLAMKLRPGIKVLFNSGYAEHAIFQSGLLDEGVPLITKPFRKQQLAAKITEVLGS